jgi:hypothetical protein
LREGFEQRVASYFNTPAVAGDQLRFTLAGVNGDVALRNGAEVLQFAADGTLTVTLAPGQTAASFTLVSQTDIDADRDLQLTATLVDSQGTAFGAASALNVHLSAKVETDNTADTTYTFGAVPVNATVTGLLAGYGSPADYVSHTKFIVPGGPARSWI